MGMMSIVVPTEGLKLKELELKEGGDTRINWDPANEEEVASAQATFDRLTRHGFDAFAVTEDAGQGGRVNRFDPQARLLIFAPRRMAGG